MALFLGLLLALAVGAFQSSGPSNRRALAPSVVPPEIPAALVRPSEDSAQHDAPALNSQSSPVQPSAQPSLEIALGAPVQTIPAASAPSIALQPPLSAGGGTSGSTTPAPTPVSVPLADAPIATQPSALQSLQPAAPAAAPTQAAAAAPVPEIAGPLGTRAASPEAPLKPRADDAILIAAAARAALPSSGALPGTQPQPLSVDPAGHTEPPQAVAPPGAVPQPEPPAAAAVPAAQSPPGAIAIAAVSGEEPRAAAASHALEAAPLPLATPVQSEAPIAATAAAAAESTPGSTVTATTATDTLTVTDSTVTATPATATLTVTDSAPDSSLHDSPLDAAAILSSTRQPLAALAGAGAEVPTSPGDRREEPPGLAAVESGSVRAEAAAAWLGDEAPERPAGLEPSAHAPFELSSGQAEPNPTSHDRASLDSLLESDTAHTPAPAADFAPSSGGGLKPHSPAHSAAASQLDLLAPEPSSAQPEQEHSAQQPAAFTSRRDWRSEAEAEARPDEGREDDEVTLLVSQEEASARQSAEAALTAEQSAALQHSEGGTDARQRDVELSASLTDGRDPLASIGGGQIVRAPHAVDRFGGSPLAAEQWAAGGRRHADLASAGQASAQRQGGRLRSWLHLLYFAFELGLAALALALLAKCCPPVLDRSRDSIVDWFDAALDAARGDPDEDDGSHLPLVQSSQASQAHASQRHNRRTTHAWRLLHTFIAQARTYARTRGARSSSAATSSAAAGSHPHAEDEEGSPRGVRASESMCSGLGGGGKAHFEIEAELLPMKRRQTPAARGSQLEDFAFEPRESDGGPLLHSHAHSGSLPRLPSLSRMISELWTPPLLNSSSDPPALVSGEGLRAICREVLPRRFGIKDWRLVYSTDQHGCSLHTAYARVAECATGQCLLIVQDTAGHVFGGYSSVPPRPDGQYRGTGETCLFRVSPRFDVFRWTHANELFVLGAHDFFAFGSGPAFGLRVDDAFEHGSSGRSDTYDNPCLASAHEFRILKAEIWSFV